MKGKISKNLEAILRDDDGRRLLRRSLITGKDSEITIGRTRYRVSTKSGNFYKPGFASSYSGRFERRTAR